MTYESAVKVLAPIQKELSSIAVNQDEILKQLTVIHELLQAAFNGEDDVNDDKRSVKDVCGDLINLIMVRVYPNNDAIAGELAQFKTVLAQIDTVTRGQVKLYS